MEGVLGYSKLNPLATCFVPSTMRKTVLHDTKHLKEKEKTKKQFYSIVKIKTKLGFKRTNRIDIFINGVTLCEILKMTRFFVKLLNESLYFKTKSVNSEFSKTIPSKSQRSGVDGAALLKYLLYSLLGVSTQNERSKTSRFKEKETDSKVHSQVEEKCNCPPMFGCIVPPDFFGNPFNLKSTCNKKNVHVCHHLGESVNTAASTTHQDSIKNEKENCNGSSESSSCRFDSIGDGRNGLSRKGLKKHNATSCLESKSGITFNIHWKAEELLVSKDYPSLFPFDNSSTKNKAFKCSPSFVDDDFHPLLDEGICMEADDGVFNEIDDVLETKFRLNTKAPRLSFDPEELAEPIGCNPPCSVWCDSLPQSAKETYKKYVRGLPRSVCALEQGHPERLTSVFNHRDFNEKSQSSFSFEPMKNFHRSIETNRTFIMSSETKSKVQQLCNWTRENQFALRAAVPAKVNERESKGCKMNMWRIVDGKDSLWQAMPECSPQFKARF